MHWHRVTATHFCMTAYSLRMLAEKLNMEQEDAERWIVDLIRNARLVLVLTLLLIHVAIIGCQNWFCCQSRDHGHTILWPVSTNHWQNEGACIENARYGQRIRKKVSATWLSPWPLAAIITNINTTFKLASIAVYPWLHHLFVCYLITDYLAREESTPT